MNTSFTLANSTTSGKPLGKNPRLVTNEPVEFEIKPVEFEIKLVEVGDLGRSTDQFRGIYGKIYLK
jgi:hypothetical protein